MLRSCIAQARCSIPSPGRNVASIHTSGVLLTQARRKIQARSTKKLNLLRRQERQRIADANRPHVVLGTRPDEDDKWQNCDLAKIIINQEDVINDTEPHIIDQPVGTLTLPKYLGFGVGDTEKKKLFENLPVLSAETRAVRERAFGEGSETWTPSRHEEAEREELRKANTFAKLLDLRNANAGGIAYENRKRIVAEFSTPDNPFDTGRPEVQAALLTYKIRNLWAHLITFKKDVASRRSLRHLIHQRAKVLRYLKRVDRNRYDSALERLALSPEIVEGELVV